MSHEHSHTGWARTDAHPPDAIDFWKIAGLLPKQITFLKKSQQHRYMLYGGARGGGKSRLLRWGLLWLLLEWYQRLGMRDVVVGLFCEDYPALEKRQINKIAIEFPRWLGEVKSTRRLGLGFYLRPEYGGGVIVLANLDDPSKYLSAEFAQIAVDELTKNVIATFNMLRGSLRWPGIPRTGLWGATNPGGIGHPWVKALWIDRDFAGEYAYLAKMAHEFGFVQSLPSDNPYLDQTYWDELDAQPEAIRRAWVLGLWDSFIGQAFPEFRQALHCREFEAPDDWTPAAGMDWGYDRPGWFGLSYWGPELRHQWRWEYSFGRGGTHGPQTPYDVGFAIGMGLQPFRAPRVITLDSACFDTSYQGQPIISDAVQLQNGLNAAWANNVWDAPQFVPATKGPGSRATRKTLMHSALKWTPGPDKNNELANIPKWLLPKMTIHPDCKQLLRTLPLLVVEEDDASKIDKDCDDHPFDGATYCMSAQHPQLDDGEPEPLGTGRLPVVDNEGRRGPRRLSLTQAMGGGTAPRWTRHAGGESSSDLGGLDY